VTLRDSSRSTRGRTACSASAEASRQAALVVADDLFKGAAVAIEARRDPARDRHQLLDRSLAPPAFLALDPLTDRGLDRRG
jgi:hypothetical protein